MKRDQPPVRSGATARLRGDAGVIVLLGTMAALYFTREILIPLAFAVVLTILLTPAVGLLQKLRIGRVMAVLVTVMASVGVIIGVS
jgi:predicted PurR-regulated permease PerM